MIKAAFIVPHPPLIVPDVGNGQEKDIQKTIDSYHQISKEIAELAPQTIVVISPHAVAYSDYIHVAPGKKIKGHLKQFGGEQIMEAYYDTEAVHELCRLCDEIDFPAGILGEKDSKMDHGTFVPLYFVNQYYKDYQLILCSLSGMSREEHYRFGMLLNDALDNLSRTAVVIASGDLSHKLKESGPYEYAKEGPELDRQLTSIMKSGNFLDFLTIDEELCRMGAECGLGSFVTMAGLLNKKMVIPEFLSYEGTFGVGYAVCCFRVAETDENRDFLINYQNKKQQKMNAIRQEEDDFVRLARVTLEQYVLTDRLMNLPDNLPDEMLCRQAGTFVSIKKDGKLRGCIGTIASTQANIALEIMYNAISSGTNDSRFLRVSEEELSSLVYHVDVLSPPGPVTDRQNLDPKKFGVIVTKGEKRGLLLPNLEGVNTVEEQIDIACQKAGIRNDGDFKLEYFEVVRHT